jgi:hypothetical protein
VCGKSVNGKVLIIDAKIRKKNNQCAEINIFYITVRQASRLIPVNACLHK